MKELKDFQFKRAFTTRNVDLQNAYVSDKVSPNEGDLLIARVASVKQQSRLETPEGRRAYLFDGDLVVGVAGKRYSTKYYRGSAMPNEKAQLLTTSGIFGLTDTKSKKVKAATELDVVGSLVTNNNTPINLLDHRSLPASTTPDSTIPILLVIGSDMDSGKTTLATSAIKGLSQSSKRVYGFKLTGSGSGPDYWKMWDSGAAYVSDFMEAGYAATSGLTSSTLVDILNDAINDATSRGSDVIVLEVADGILQKETAELLRDAHFKALINGVLIASDSAVSALHISQQLTHLNYRVVGLGGVFTQHPLAIEEFSSQSGYPILSLELLQNRSGGDLIFSTITAYDKNDSVKQAYKAAI